MNQNPEIAATPNSITLEIMKDLFLLKDTDVFQIYPDHKSLNNILDIVYDLYYKDWPQRIIIDRGPVMASGNPGNFELMKVHYKRPFKCIVLLRNLMNVLASYMKWYTENPDAFPNRYNLKNDEEKLNKIMNKDGAVVKELSDINFLVHGTTVGLNSFLERKGARVLLVMTSGISDTYTVARGYRKEL